MNILRLSTIALTLAITVFALGFVNPSFADKTGEKHNHGGGGEDPPPPPEDCMAPPCIVSVGKSLRQAAADFVLDGGTYTVMSSQRFGELLGEIPPEMSAKATDLCAAFDVVIFEWNNTKIKNLTWQRLKNYMACGGGIIFESPRNVEALAPVGSTLGVATLEINFRSTDVQPITITLLPVCVLTEGPPVNDVPCGTGEIDLTVVNQHMTFNNTGASDSILMPFLTLADGTGIVVGLYGKHGNGGIVLTGPDNHFHGDLNEIPAISPAINIARANMHKLLHNEINWLLSL